MNFLKFWDDSEKNLITIYHSSNKNSKISILSKEMLIKITSYSIESKKTIEKNYRLEDILGLYDNSFNKNNNIDAIKMFLKSLKGNIT